MGKIQDIENQVKENIKMQTSKCKKSKVVLQVVVALLIAVISFTFLSKAIPESEINMKTIETLDNKRNIVMGLSVAAVTIATTASLILGDRATPISTKLMDLTGYFLIILSAILLEKYLASILGVAAFKFIIPIASLVYIIALLIIKNEHLKVIAKKVAVFAIIVSFTIPASVALSNFIESKYENNYENVLYEVDNTSSELEKAVDAENGTEEMAETESLEETEKKAGIFEGVKGFISNAGEKVKTVSSSVVNKVKGVGSSAKELFDKTTKTLSKMIETIAIMIVTTCVIPILVLVFFLWLVKLFFNVNIDLNDLRLSKLINKENEA